MSKNGNYRLNRAVRCLLALVFLMCCCDLANAGRSVQRITKCTFPNGVASCDALDKVSYPSPYIKIIAANAESDQYYCIQPGFNLPDGRYIGEHGQIIGSCNYACPDGSIWTWGYPSNDNTSDLTLFCYADDKNGDTDTGGGTSGGKDGSSSGTNTSGTSGSSGSTSGQTGGANSSGQTTSGSTSGSTSGGSTSGGSTSGGSTSGGSTSGSTSGGSTSGTGQTSGGYTSGAQTSGGDTSGNTTSGGSTSGGSTSGGSSSGGSTSGTTSGGSTSSGGTTSGGNQNGGNGGTPGTDDFCTQHPTLTICKNSSVTGMCAETSCDGDAIQCAILRTQQKRDCEDHDDKHPQYVLGKNILDGVDPMKSVLPSVDKASEIDVARDIRADGFGGGASSCATDKEVSILGQSIAIPLSKVCDYLLPLRFAIMLIASIVSFKMLSGVILRD